MVMELVSPSGLLLRRDVSAAGYDDTCLTRMVRSGQIVRIRQGAYAIAQTWRALDDAGRHRLLCEAVVLQYDDGIALSHGSGVVELGGPTYGLPMDKVHVTHLSSRAGRRNVAGVVHHEGSCGLLDVTRLGDHWLTSPARTVLDVTMSYGFEVGVVVADDFLRRKLTTKDELRQLYGKVREWPGAITLRLVIDFADERSESVGESLARLLFRRLGLPRPVLQFEIFGPGHRLAGRTDFAWPEHRVFGEFDGKTKYLRLRRPGESVTDTVLREKRREDLLREITDWRCIRLIWADLFEVEQTARRLLAILFRPAA
jgi:hypothetical protein